MRYDYLNILKELVSKYIPADEYIVFLFGSRAAHSNHDRSDIDIGVWGTKPLPILIKVALEEEIEESRIPFRVDIVDFSRVGDQFKKEALQTIEVWNYPQNLSIPLKTWNLQ